MHFVLLNAEFAMNGAALLLSRWAQHLARGGHRVTAVHAERAEGPLRDVYLAAGVELTASYSIDGSMVVVCNTLMAAPLVLRASAQAKTIWWLHESELGLLMLQAHPDWIAAFAKAHAVIFPSAPVRDQVFRSFLFNVPERRLHIVPPGLDPAPAEPAAAPRPPGPARIVCVGAICPNKRQVDLIRAVARLSDLPVECAFVGNFVSLDEAARDIARSAPERFIFKGEQPHAEALRSIAGADILALPSTSECLPIAPLEAGMRGKAVVLSDLPAHEGVWRHGRNCLMHPSGDFVLLAHMLRILVVDGELRSRLGQAARQTATGFRNDLFLTRLGMVVASVL